MRLYVNSFRLCVCVCVREREGEREREREKCLPRRHVAFSCLTQVAALCSKVCHLQDKYVIEFTVLLERVEKDAIEVGKV